MQIKINQTVLELVEGDITEADTEAIVNAANEALVLGGGVAGAIRTKGGPAIQNECDKIGPTVVGCAVKTTAGRLKAQYVIHAVGPRMGEGDEDAKLRSATLSSLALADRDGIKTVTFPAISTGVSFAVRTSWQSSGVSARSSSTILVAERGPGGRAVKRGSSRSTVVRPTKIPSIRPRNRWTTSRDRSFEIHRDWPVRVAIFPSSDMAHLAITQGRPVSMSFK